MTTDDSSNHLDKYLVEKIRKAIESRHYVKINEQSMLAQAINDLEFLDHPDNAPVLFSDHGVVHVRDVANQLLLVLERIHGVLIPFRESCRFAFMNDYGVMVAYLHDIGMQDFSKFGRIMHPEVAAQTVYRFDFDPIIESIWVENSRNVSGRLQDLADRQILRQPPKIVLREILAMAHCHSKSKVPVEVLNNPKRLRQVMQIVCAVNLRYLYEQLQREKAIKPKQNHGGKTNLPGVLSQDDTFWSNLPNRMINEDFQRFYANLENDSFQWLISPEPELHNLVTDVLDTLRALRCADALRQRGTVLKTSGSYEIFVDQHNANAIFAIRFRSSELYLLELSNPFSAGEANIASSELGHDGNLRISFHRGAFSTLEAIQRSAYNAAFMVNDIQGDVITSFDRVNFVDNNPHENLKKASELQIHLEGVDDNLEFAHLVHQELLRLNPQAGAKARVVPSLKNVPEAERHRYLAAQEFDWDKAARKDLIKRVAKSGNKITKVDLVEGFQDVRLARLKPGEILLLADDPSCFVYIPLQEGLVITPLGGYQSFSVQAWMPLGITGVIRGAPRNATIIAEQAVTLIIIPKEVYLKYWYAPYTSTELKQILTLRRDENT